MKKAIFLDRDGTINVEKNYLYKIEDFEFLPRVIDALKILQDAGFCLIIVTNQSGIARGFYSEEDLRRLHDWMTDSLLKQGIKIEHIYYCPHHPEASVDKYRKNCEYRKPGIGMYMHAVADFDIDLEKSYAIGDKLRDCAICKMTECKGFLIGSNEDAEAIEEVKQGKYKRTEYASSLHEAALSITMQK